VGKKNRKKKTGKSFSDVENSREAAKKERTSPNGGNHKERKQGASSQEGSLSREAKKWRVSVYWIIRPGGEKKSLSTK